MYFDKNMRVYNVVVGHN